MSKKYRAVILGDSLHGEYGHHMDLAFGRMPTIEVVGISDPENEGLKKSIKSSNAQRGYSDYREMLHKEKADIAVIAPRWCGQRKAMVMACMEAGIKGIYMEKPCAATLEEADAMLEACESAGVKVANDHWRACEEVRKAKEIIESGMIGEIKTIRGHGKADARSGGVDLMVLGTHVLDAIRYLADSDVMWAHGQVTKDGKDVTIQDAFEGPEEIGLTAGNALTAQYAFCNGVTGYYESIEASQDTDQQLSKGTSYLGLEIYGSKGILCLRSRDLRHYAKGLWMPGDTFEKWKTIPISGWEAFDLKTYYQYCHEICLKELMDALEEKRPIGKKVSTLKDGRAALEMIMAVHESHLAGRRITFPLQKRTNPYARTS